jgi:predicted RecA/RadA family phage recombinase
MKNFVQPGDVVTMTASASGATSGDLIVAATSPVIYLIGTAIKATATLGAIVRVRSDGVAVVAADT